MRVAPGERTVYVTYLPPAGVADAGRLRFTAQPGQTYRVQGRTSTIPVLMFSGGWDASLVHVATGAVVATAHGSLRSR